MGLNEIVVLIIFAAVAYLVIFWIATLRADRGAGGRALAIAVGVVTLPGATVLALIATFFEALRCDENCNENYVPSARTPGWHNTIHAWQWDAQWVLALVVLAAVLVATILVGLRRRRAAMGAAAIAAVCAVAWALLIAS